MSITKTNNLKDTKVQKEVVANLIETSSPTRDFYLMIVFSSIIVCLGLLLNNVVIVIGGMVLTPFLFPLLMLALSFVVSDKLVIRRSVGVTLKSILVIVASGIGAVILVPKGNVDFTLIDKIVHINLSYFYVSLAAGGVAAYTWARPNLSSLLPGVAISVAVFPPFVGLAIALAFFNWSLFFDFVRSGLANILGIILSATFVFSILGFYRVRDYIKKEISVSEKEEKQKEAQ